MHNHHRFGGGAWFFYHALLSFLALGSAAALVLIFFRSGSWRAWPDLEVVFLSLTAVELVLSHPSSRPGPSCSEEDPSGPWFAKQVRIGFLSGSDSVREVSSRDSNSESKQYVCGSAVYIFCVGEKIKTSPV